MRPRTNDNEELHADEAKILADQDETQDVIEAEPGELEDRPGEMYAGEGNDFVTGEVDVKQQMDRRTREADRTLVRRYKPDKMKPVDNNFDDKAVPTAPRPNRAWDPEMPGTEPSPR